METGLIASGMRNIQLFELATQADTDEDVVEADYEIVEEEEN